MIIPNNNTLETSTAERWGLRVVAAALALLALTIARPWIDRPFDTIDFSEFLPFLRERSGLLARIAGLSGYYIGEHGRFNVVSYVALASKWTLLGPSPVLWQWLRVGEMGLLVAMVYVFFRRMAIGPLAALAGASLFILDRDATEAWTRMTMGEPLGLLLALGALLFATRRRAWEAGVCLALAVLAKEMMIGLLPFVWLVALGRDDAGHLGRPTMDLKTGGRWIAVSSVLPLLAFAIAIAVALGGRSQGFTALYGTGSIRPMDLLTGIGRPWPGDIVALVLLVAGLGAVWLDPRPSTGVIGALFGAAGLSLAYAVLYLPWPYHYNYYALPFLLGPALLFAVAMDRLFALGGKGRAAAFWGWALMTVTSASVAAQAASHTIALQQVNGEVVGFLARVPNADRIVVARGRLSPEAWMGTAAMLRRYALATGAARTLPPATDLLCPQAGALLQAGVGRSILVSYQEGCGLIADASAHLERVYRYPRFGLEGIGVMTDSVGADVVLTRAALAPAEGPR